MRLPVLIAAALLSTALLFGQSTTMPVVITHSRTVPASSEAEKKVRDQLETSLADAIQEQLPCAVPTTPADLKDRYDEAKSRQSASDEENDDLARTAAELGARDMIRVGVKATGDKYAIDAAYLDTRTARALARASEVLDGSEAALDEFARKFAETLRAQPRFASAACTAEREWSGVVRYSFHGEPKSDETTKECQSWMRSKEDWKYSIRIPAVGPATAMVRMSRVVLENSECTRKIWCGAREWVDETRYSQGTNNWVGAQPVKVLVRFDNVYDKLYVTFDLPAISADVSMEGENGWHSACATSLIPQKSEYQSKGPLVPRNPTIPPQVVAADQKKLSGSAVDGDGGKTSWRLVRTNKK